MFRKLLLPHCDVPDAQESPLRAGRLLPRAFSCMLGLASIGLFWAPLHQLVSLSLDDRRYSHLILIPVISAFVMYMERRRIFSRIASRPRAGLPFLAAALAIYSLLAFHVVHPPVNYAPSIAMLVIVLAWAAGFAVCYGVQTSKAAMLPPASAVDRAASVR